MFISFHKNIFEKSELRLYKKYIKILLLHSSFCPWDLSPSYLNKLRYTIKCLENFFLTIAVDDPISFLMAYMGKVTKINIRAFMWLRKCSLPPVFVPSLFFSGDVLKSTTHWSVPCPSAQERTSCSWLNYGKELAPTAHLDTSTLAIMCWAQKSLSLFYQLILIFLFGMGQPYVSLGRLLILIPM